MPDTANLQLVVNSEGVRIANERLKAQTEASAALERASERLAATLEASSRQQAASAQRAAAAAEQTAQRRAEAAERSAQRAAEAEARATARQQASEEKSILRVKKQLMSEEQLIRQSENERRRIIIENTTITEAQRAELLKLSAAKTQGQLANMGKSGAQGGAQSGIIGEVGPMLAGIVTLGLFKTGIDKVIEETVGFEKLRARLQGVTGSIEGAESAFAKLQQISKGTMSTEEELTEVFLLMRAAGVDPSERALKSFANIAAGTGRSLGEVAESAVHASMGMARAWRAFHVQAVTDGDKLHLTFRGHTETIKNEAQSIQEYLIRIGETKFSGSSERQLESMGGKIKILRQEWNELFRDMGRGILGDVIKADIEGVTLAIEALNKSLGLGGGGFSKAITVAQKAATYAIVGFESLGASAKYVNDVLAALVTKSTLADARRNFESEMARIRATGLGALADLDAEQKKRENKAKEKPELPEAEKVGHDRKYDKSAGRDRERELAELKKDLQLSESAIESSYEKRQQLIDKLTKKDSQERYAFNAQNRAKAMDELTKGMKTEEQKIEDSFRIREEAIVRYANKENGERERQAKANKDIRDKELKDLADKKDSEYQSVRNSLKKEEDVVRESYAKQRKIVEDSLHGQEEKRATLRGLEKKEAFDIAAIRNKTEGQALRRADMLADPNDEQSAIKRERDHKLQALTELSREDVGRKDINLQRQIEEAKYRIRAEYARKSTELEVQHMQQVSQNAETLFGNLATAAKKWGGEQSGIYEAMFALQKSFAVAVGTLDMFQSIANAQAATDPMTSAILAVKAAAQGAAVLAEISSTNFSGGHDLGGRIPAGSVGLVGERGPEFVRGPADVTSRSDTAKLLQGGGQQRIRIVNAYDAGDAVHQYLSSTQGERVIVNHVKRNWKTIRAVGGTA